MRRDSAGDLSGQSPTEPALGGEQTGSARGPGLAVRALAIGAQGRYLHYKQKNTGYQSLRDRWRCF